MRTRVERGKAQWLLIKHRDEFAQPGSDVVAEYDTSVVTGRTMDEIAGGRSKVWQSNRKEPTRKTHAASKKVIGAAPRLDLDQAIMPMLATLGKELSTGDGWTFEPKYDGIRVLAFVTPSDVRADHTQRKG